jgi:hypothetical protein
LIRARHLSAGTHNHRQLFGEDLWFGTAIFRNR